MKTLNVAFVKLMLVALLFAPFIIGGSTITSHAAPTTEATESSTETSTVEGGSVGDINVSMDSNGNLTTTFDDASDSTTTWNTIFAKYKVIITGFSGILTLTFVILFLINIFRVGATADNPTDRRKALIGVLWTGLAAAGCGSVTMICALFWNALK